MIATPEGYKRVAIRARDLRVGDITVGSGQEVLDVYGPFRDSYDGKVKMQLRLRRTTGRRITERTARWGASTTMTVLRP